VLKRPHSLKPVRCAGRLGLWTPSAGLIKRLTET
jgi:hypothetical protein